MNAGFKIFQCILFADKLLVIQNKLYALQKSVCKLYHIFKQYIMKFSTIKTMISRRGIVRTKIIISNGIFKQVICLANDIEDALQDVCGQKRNSSRGKIKVVDQN